jgi:hypothetical protein
MAPEQGEHRAYPVIVHAPHGAARERAEVPVADGSELSKLGHEDRRLQNVAQDRLVLSHRVHVSVSSFRGIRRARERPEHGLVCCARKPQCFAHLAVIRDQSNPERVSRNEAFDCASVQEGGNLSLPKGGRVHGGVHGCEQAVLRWGGEPRAFDHAVLGHRLRSSRLPHARLPVVVRARLSRALPCEPLSNAASIRARVVDRIGSPARNRLTVRGSQIA